MKRIVRAALTETRNAYSDMPGDLGRLDELAGRLRAVREANVIHNIDLVAEAASHGTHIICLGELFTGPYFALRRDIMWRELAEDALRGPTVTAFREVAKRHNIVIVAPIYELCADSGKRFNTAVVIDASGDVLGKYRKTHIPEGQNERGSFHEKYYYEASDGNLGRQVNNVSKNPYFPVWDVGLCKIGVAICYDRHFPGVMRSLAMEGAEVVLCPAVTFGEKSRVMWDHEFVVDAARYKMIIGGSNRRGREPPFEQEYFGGSYFVGPNGRFEPVLFHPRLLIADLDLDQARHPDPSGWDIPRDLRPDIYTS